MPVAEYQLSELKRAYQILGVSGSASATSIKQTYHRLAKRWHPDLYPSGTLAHAEATQMMKVINEAYSIIAHAPLRYHIESYPLASAERSRGPVSSQVERHKPYGDTLPITDRFEFWVRFVCGCLLGTLMSIELFLNLYDQPKLLIVGSVGLILLCGFAAARYGDRFWSKILEYGWLWW